MFKDWGFINILRFFQTPGGNVDDGVIRMLKEFGFEYGAGVARPDTDSISYIETMNRYDMHNFSLLPTDTQGRGVQNAKNAIDYLMASGGGVLCITTHFANWGDLVYDTTLDSNGYPVGYARFNEVVQYAIASGAQIMTIPEAYETIRSYYTEQTM